MVKKQIFRSLLPSPFETWIVVFGSILILLVGNARDLLERYGLIQSSQIVKDQLAHGVGSGLGRLDSFSATKNIVSFMLWGLVGLITFSIVQALVRIAAHRTFERELTSDHYIHPAGFDPNAFWKSIAIHAVMSFVLLAATIAGLVLYLMRVLPISFEHARSFLLSPSPSRVIELVVGLVILLVGTWVLYAIARLAFRHHRFDQP